MRPDAGDRHRPAGRGGHGAVATQPWGPVRSSPPISSPWSTGGAHRAGPHLRGPEARGGHLGAAAAARRVSEALVRGRGAQAAAAGAAWPHGGGGCGQPRGGQPPGAVRRQPRQRPGGHALPHAPGASRGAPRALPPPARRRAGAGGGRAARGSSPSAAAPSLRGTPACMGHAPRHSAAARRSPEAVRRPPRGPRGRRRVPPRAWKPPRQRYPEPVQGLDAGGPEEVRGGAHLRPGRRDGRHVRQWGRKPPQRAVGRKHDRPPAARGGRARIPRGRRCRVRPGHLDATGGIYFDGRPRGQQSFSRRLTSASMLCLISSASFCEAVQPQQGPSPPACVAFSDAPSDPSPWDASLDASSSLSARPDSLPVSPPVPPCSPRREGPVP